MSAGVACTNPKAHRAHWRVVARECNYSAFNGYRYTPSDYSAVRCLVCLGSWRTKAAYVRTLPNGTHADVEQAVADAAGTAETPR